ncbi:hypothetical protein ASPWEDRAFT_290190 [Aspergillus wentii DTO 134E9]|uniref:MOSC domain-containing protein n=1 Tax=Aspergillus wentii DTO 134E9 TaxID=1073089 RepID=A0A1L9S3Y5_ASPWE|nr:uncharacterized protein ASPWEDRAFT_290190 [Aspergillus wentii DTO 134E9]KAI9930211.1 hypothetical protein MW887_012023 [Aspergillus wentii]OJJ41885.1 hypothetical protein ASPWEDRAFT_290190 [Aspergillus wentii DTO 134E9]
MWDIVDLQHHAENIVSSVPALTLVCFLPVLVILLQYSQSHPNRPKGCRILGLPSHKTNLHDEYDPKYTNGVPNDHIDEQGLPSWRIKALFTYPIKSCAGVELDVADVVPTGLAYDRQFCFAEYITPNNPNSDIKPHWNARTLRDGHFSKMILIRSDIWVPDPTAADYNSDLDEVKSQGVMVISYPRVSGDGLKGYFMKLGMRLRLISREYSFQVPLYPPPDQMSAYPSLPVKIWKDFPVSHDYGKHIPQSLRDYLASPSDPKQLTLFRVNPAHHRQIFRCAPRKEEMGFQTVTGFADAYPLHLLNLASVRDVAARCAQDIPYMTIRRFRANIIMQGPEAFAEDHWKRVLVRPSSSGGENDSSGICTDGVEIHTVCRTVRCRLPNVDPDTGIRHRSEPDRTMKAYRKIDQGDLTNACLGMQLVPAVQEFTIRVNDPISVLETGEHFYIKMLAPGEKVEGV